MAKIGDACAKCGKEITKYPIYGDTCCTCNYREFIETEIPKILINLTNFHSKRVKDGCDVSNVDMLIPSILEVLDKMTDKDIEAINYIIETVRERY
jgi:DNA-directed RNA polymerase subunit RPC12/RpoP